jgi:hypothetical protein
MRRRTVSIFVLAVSAATSCAGNVTDPLPDGGRSDAGSDAGRADSGPGSDGGNDGGAFTPAPHVPLPLLVFHNGTVFTHPQVVTVTWPEFAFESDAQAFGDGVVASQWLTTVSAEYGVTGATHLSKAMIDAGTASITDAQLQGLLNASIATGTLPSPLTTPQLLFLIFTPPGLALDASAITKSGALCGAYYGYHYFSSYDGGRYAYAVSGDCDGQIGSITQLASHELLEATIDPFNDGYFIDAPTTDDWVLFRGVESADLCQAVPSVTEFGYALERGWSNAAVDADLTPCVPVPAGEIPYSDVSPAQGEVMAVDAGDTVQVSLTGWAVAARADWPVSVQDWPAAAFLTHPQLSVTTMNNGTQATLTISVPPGTPAGQLGSAVVYSGSTNGRYWPITLRSR